MTEQQPRYERFGWNADEFEKIPVAPQQEDPRLKRWIDLGFTPEEAERMVGAIG